jgi:5-methylcytosine-specific restriction endonuclease McrA
VPIPIPKGTPEDAGLSSRLAAHNEALTHCANCDEELTVDNQTLFCDATCRQVAHYVRYARGVAKDPKRRRDPEVIEALRIQRAFVLGGGYPEEARRLTAAERRFVIERDGGLCQECGKPGDQIDHIDGSSNDPINLQLLCDPCHRKKTTANFQPASAEQVEYGLRLQHERIDPAAPTRACDDEQCLEETGTTRAEWKGMPWSEVWWEWLERVGAFDGPADADDFIGG